MKIKVLSYLSLIVVLTGCTTPRENTAISPLSMAKPAKVVIAEVSGLEKPGYYKAGAQGLLEFAVNEAIGSSLAGEIEKIDAKPIVEANFHNLFEKALQDQSFQVAKVEKPLNKDELSSFDNDTNKFAPYDFRGLKGKYNAEYALVLYPHSFGVQRYYSGFIPVGSPYGIAQLSFYLVRLSDNALLAHYTAAEFAHVAGEWDTPPAYKKLTEASKKTLKRALTDAKEYLFSNFPQSDSSS